MGFHRIIVDPPIVGSWVTPYFMPLQDIHPIAFEFWGKLRVRLPICNSRLLHDE